MTELARTPFYERQAAAGARFVPFAGYEMAVQVSGVKAEHLAVRNEVGLFDVSHMGEVVIEGPGATAALQTLITNDVEKIADGRALYSVMCQEDGGIVDDLIVYRESPTRFFLVINASRRRDDIAHMQRVLADHDCSLDDQSEQWALLALQGPEAGAVLAGITELDLASLKAFHFIDGEVGGCSGVRVARTGYTGEDGFELYCPTDRAVALWDALFEARPTLTVCGLGARDTLRLEMKFPLYGNDLDLAHNPYEAGLGWVVKLDKGDFVGRAALEAVKRAGPARKWVGFAMEGRGIPRQGYPIRVDDATGVVTSGTHSPTLGAPIGAGYVPTEHSAVGTAIEIEIRGKAVPARIVKTPFISR